MGTGRPSGGRNHMRTPEEKEAIVLEYLNGKAGSKTVASDHGISKRLFHEWVTRYRRSGIEGLKSKSGKNNPNLGRYDRHPSETEKLKKEILKKEIEIERLKKAIR